MVKIYGTGKSAWMPKGEVYHEGLEMAEHLVSIGAASYEAPKEAELKPTPEATPKNKQAAPAPKNKK